MDRQNFIIVFGCGPGYNVKADTRMIKDIADTMLEKYEKIHFTLTFPDVLDDLFSGDATFEMSASNTIQPLKIFYIHNVVTHSTAIIFVDENYRYDIKKGKVAEDMLKTYLNFEEVVTYVGLSKSQMIEKLDLMQCFADCFHHRKHNKDKPTRRNWLLLIAIINIGCFFPVET